MPNARAGAYATETCVGDQGDGLSMRQVSQCGSELIGLLHTGSHRAATHEYDHIPGLHGMIALALHGSNGSALAGEHTRWAGFAIDAIFIHDSGIDGRAFNDRSLRREIACQERDRTGQATLARLRRVHDHIIRIDPIEFMKTLTQFTPAFTALPFI